jgi:hypothetical protein
MDTFEVRKVYLYELVRHADFLSRTESFSSNICRCNFVYHAGWGGKLYVDDHNAVENKPDLRGIHVLTNLYYIRSTDWVILTEEQYKDYCVACNPNNP